MNCQPIRGIFKQNGNATVLARLGDAPTSRYAFGTPYTQAAIASILCTVQVNNSTTWSGSLDVASVISDTLEPWPLDSLGYNFRHAIPAAALPTAPATATIVYVVTLVDGYVEPFEVLGEVRAYP